MSTSATTFVPEAGQPSADHDHHHGHEQSFFFKYIWSLDHKMIGLQYLWTSFFFLFIGGLLAMGIRYQLAYPGVPVPLIGSLLPSTIAVDGVILPGGYNMTCFSPCTPRSWCSSSSCRCSSVASATISFR